GRRGSRVRARRSPRPVRGRRGPRDVDAPDRGGRRPPAALCRKPGHHDRGCGARRRTDRRADAGRRLMLRITDSSLHDGMHSVSHQLTPDVVATVAGALDRAGVDVVEVTHGDGIGGSSIQYGIAAASDEALVEAAVAATTRARIAVLLLPGIGTIR